MSKFLWLGLILVPTPALASLEGSAGDILLVVAAALALAVGAALWLRSHGKEAQVQAIVTKAVSGAEALHQMVSNELLQARELIEQQRQVIRKHVVEKQQQQQTLAPPGVTPPATPSAVDGHLTL